MRPPLPEGDLDFVLAHTQSFWQQFSGARMFVTGGTGFIGAWLLEVIQHANRQLSAGIEVVVLSRNPDVARAVAPHLFSALSIQLIAGDVRCFSSPAGAFDLCIHAAGDVGDGAKAGDHAQVFDAAIAGTRRVLDLALASCARRFLLTSSGAVYGVQPTQLNRVSETYTGAPDPLDVNAAYGHGKRAAEWLCAEASSRSSLGAVSARIFALIGPGMPLHGPFAAGNFVRDVLTGQQVKVGGDGRPVRSYLYAADACVWLLALLQSGASGQAYNVGAEQSLSIAELAWKVVEAGGVTHHQSGIPVVPALTTVGGAPRYVPDTAKARNALGLEAWTSLDIALQKTLQWNRLAMNA